MQIVNFTQCFGGEHGVQGLEDFKEQKWINICRRMIALVTSLLTGWHSGVFIGMNQSVIGWHVKRAC